jgi:phage terminase Nu1 subunit (DNA packaging protein)
MNASEITEQKLVNKHTIARRYDVSERTIQEWMEKGTLPILKISYMVRFDIAACDRALSRFRVSHDEFAGRVDA